MKHGRLQISDILHHTNLNSGQVQHGLAVLIQYNLVVWATETRSNSAFYEADWYAAYALLRLGKFTKAVSKRLGEDVKALFVDCLLCGHFKTCDLENRLNHEHGATDLKTENHLPSKAPDPNVNGDLLPHPDPVDSKALFHSNVYSLLQHNFLALAHEAHFRPYAENMVLAEEDTRRMSEYSGKIKKKDETAFKLAIQETLNARLHGSLEQRTAIRNQTLNKVGRSSKRHLDGDSDNSSDGSEETIVATKKRRLTNGVAKVNGTPVDGDPQPQSHVPADIALCVNYRKSAVTARTDRLVHLAEERAGPAAAEVYSTVLMLLERDIYQCSDTKQDVEAIPVNEYDEQPRVPTSDIAALIKNPNDLRSGLGPMSGPSMEQAQHRKKHRRKVKNGEHTETEVEASSSKVYIGKEKVGGTERDFGQSSERESSTNLIQNHEDNLETDAVGQYLLLLADSTIKFLDHHKSTSTQPESWSVPFRALSDQLRLIELNQHITSKYGRLATRIVGLLQEKGKVEEKHIKNAVVQMQKASQTVVMDLLSTGMIEVQEVPRDNNRQPNRTIWLYYFDADRCGRKVLEETYQAMSRCVQRLRVEGEKMKDVLNKAARTDVVGREEELLSKTDLAALKQWREREEKLLGELIKLDDTVLVLRDFQGL